MGAHRCMVVCISLLLGVVFATDARGLVFPTPITSEELDEYAIILSLTPTQRQAIEGAFQEYQQMCSAIRQEDITKFRADRKASMRDPARQFDIRVQRKYHRRSLAIRARFVALDDLFFEQLNSQLTENQQAIMLHVQHLRQRERYHNAIVRSGAVRLEAAIDLTRLIGTIDLTEADHKALAPVIQEYDGALTTDVIQYASAQIELIFIYQNPQDHEKRRRKMVELGIDVLKLNRAWLGTMASVLPEETAAKLNDTYRKEVYHGVYPDIEDLHRKFDAVLEMQQLSDDEKVAITDQRDAYVDQHTQLTEQIIAGLDDIRLSPEYWMAKRTTFTQPLEGLNELHTLMNSRKKLNVDAAEILSKYFGSGLLRSLRIAANKKYGMKELVRLPKRMPKFMQIKIAGSSMAGSLGGGSPVMTLFFLRSYPPIKTQWIKNLADDLELSESQIDIVKTLHEQYVKDLLNIRNAIPQEIVNNDQMLWVSDEDGSFLLPTIDEVAEINYTKMKIIDSLREIDNQLLDDLESFIDSRDQTVKLDEARRSRVRSLYLSRSSSRFYIMGHFLGGQSELYELDLLPLLKSIEPPAENVEQFNELRSTYDLSTALLAKDRFSASHECKLLADQVMIESFRDGDEYYELSLIGESDKSNQFSDACTRLALAEEKYYELNYSTPKKMMELLSPDVARELEDRFRKAAYPDIIKDEQAMHEKLEAALRKPDLDENDKKVLSELSAEYDQKYRVLIDKLVATQRHPRDIGYYRIDNGQVTRNFNSKYGQVSQEVTALKFERKEFNTSIQRRLDSILENEDSSQP